MVKCQTGHAMSNVNELRTGQGEIRWQEKLNNIIPFPSLEKSQSSSSSRSGLPSSWSASNNMRRDCWCKVSRSIDIEYRQKKLYCVNCQKVYWRQGGWEGRRSCQGVMRWQGWTCKEDGCSGPSRYHHCKNQWHHQHCLLARLGCLCPWIHWPGRQTWEENKWGKAKNRENKLVPEDK